MDSMIAYIAFNNLWFVFEWNKTFCFICLTKVCGKQKLSLKYLVLFEVFRQIKKFWDLFFQKREILTSPPFLQFDCAWLHSALLFQHFWSCWHFVVRYCIYIFTPFGIRPFYTYMLNINKNPITVPISFNPISNILDKHLD